MEITCTLCNVTRNQGYQWESHLATAGHRQAKNESDRAGLLNALRYVASVCPSDFTLDDTISITITGAGLHYILAAIERAEAQ